MPDPQPPFMPYASMAPLPARPTAPHHRSTWSVGLLVTAWATGGGLVVGVVVGMLFGVVLLSPLLVVLGALVGGSIGFLAGAVTGASSAVVMALVRAARTDRVAP